MSFSINAFSDLCASYPSWTELSAFLVSDEGGKLRVVQTEGSSYVIVRYTKGVSNFALPHVPLFRSVVWNTVTNRPVSIAPPKAEEGEPGDVAVRVSDFVDGTMIQAWQDGDQLQIATRTSLGAKGGFYSTRSFADMLNDALKGSGGTDKFLRSVLKSGQFVSLVLQHKDHKTVAPIPYNRVFVCYFGSVDSDGGVTMTQDASVWPERLASYAPQLYSTGVTSAKSLLQENQNKGYSWQGLVFQDMASSRRWRLRNPAYVIVRTLRGPEASQAARFLRLRHSGNVKQYLSYFREESNMMWDFEKTLRQRSAELYGAYNDMNKLKTKSMRDLPYSLRPHVYALHGKYLAQLSADKADKAIESISKATVIDYVNALAVEDQLKLLEGDRVPLARQAQAHLPLAVPLASRA
jgi:hypothetical protein